MKSLQKGSAGPSAFHPQEENPPASVLLSRREFLEVSVLGGLAPAILPFQVTNSLTALEGTGIELKVAGNEKEGYGVALVYRGQLVASPGGEFSAVFQNGERSLEDRVESNCLSNGHL